MTKCYECNQDKGYFYIHDDKQYCSECYGNHVTEADAIPVEYCVVCPFCEASIRFKTCPNACKCGAKMTTFGVKAGRVRFIKWN